MGKLKLLLGPRSSAVVPPPDPGEGLMAHAGWDSTWGSGFETGNAMPTDPARTSFKAAINPLTFNWEVIYQPTDIWVQSGVDAGEEIGLVDGLWAMMEGGVPVNAPDVEDGTYVDANGDTKPIRGYRFPVDWAGMSSLHAIGDAQIVFYGTPADGRGQLRVVGTGLTDMDQAFVVCIRPTEYSHVLTVGTGGDLASYNDMHAWRIANPTAWPCFKLITAGGYPITTPSTDINEASAWPVVMADGVDAGLGNGASAKTSLRWSGLRFKKFETKVDLAWFGGNVNGVCEIPAAAGRGNSRLALDGCELFCSSPSGNGGSGSGAQSVWNGKEIQLYFFNFQRLPADRYLINFYCADVTARDLPGYGFAGAKLVRNCTGAMIGGTGFEAMIGAVHNLELSNIGGVHTGLAVKTDAFTFTTYPVGAKYSKTSANGTRGFFRLLDASDTVLHEIDLIFREDDGTTTLVTDLVAWINTKPGFAATDAPGAPIRNATYLTRKDASGNSVAITPTSISAYPTVSTVIDVHANGGAYDGGTFENFSIYGLKLVDGATTGFISLTSTAIIRDMWTANLEYIDISPSLGVTTEPSYHQADVSHMSRGLETTVLTNPPYFGTSFTAEYSVFRNCHYENLNYAQPFTASLAGDELDVTTVPGGVTFRDGDHIMQSTLATGVTIVEQISGTTGGVGVYRLSASGTISSTTFVWGPKGLLFKGCSFRNPVSVGLGFRTVYGNSTDANSKSQANTASTTLFPGLASGDLTPTSALQLADSKWAGARKGDGTPNRL